jgi:microcystin-dependent protein
MSLNFPNSPAVGQVFIAQGVSFTWTGTVWVQTGGASGSDGMPVGAVMFFAANSVPSGWLVCDNQVVTAIYPDLRQYLLDAGSPYGELNGDPRVPDLRGEFIRGFDDGRGVDPARVFGSAQVDQNRSHVHGALGGGSIARLTPGGTGGTFGFAAGTSGGGTNSTASEGGDEARPRNVALLPCIKAFAATVVEGIANFALATPEQARAGTSPDTLMTPALSRTASPYVLIADGVVSEQTPNISFFIPPDVKQVEFYQQGLVGTLASANSDIGMWYGTGPEGAPVWINGATDYFSVISVNLGSGTLSPTNQSRNQMQVATLTDTANGSFSAGRATFFGLNTPNALANALIDLTGVILPGPAPQVLKLATRIVFGPPSPLTHLRLRPGAGLIAAGRYKLIGVR